MEKEKQEEVEARLGLGGTAALEMLNTFASVGAWRFDITSTSLDQERRGFRRNQTLNETRRSLPFLVESALSRQENLIIRPQQSAHTPGAK